MCVLWRLLTKRQAVNMPQGIGPAAIGDVSVNSLTATNAVLITDRTASGTLSAEDQTVAISCEGAVTVGVQITGTFSITSISPEATIDGTTWVTMPIYAYNPTFGYFNPTIAPSTVGIYRATVSGFNQFRVKAVGYTSGTATITMRANNGTSMTHGEVLIASTDGNRLGIDINGQIASEVVGKFAHDEFEDTNWGPVKMGMKAVNLGATPTAVATDDITNWWAMRNGIPFVLAGHPNTLSQNLQITDADGAQTDTAIITAAASTAIVVTKCSVTADNANTVDVSVRIGFGTASTPAADAAQIILFHPGISAGSGVVEGNGAGIIGIGASNEDLRVTCEDPTTGSISIIVTYFTISI